MRGAEKWKTKNENANENGNKNNIETGSGTAVEATIAEQRIAK